MKRRDVLSKPDDWPFITEAKPLNLPQRNTLDVAEKVRRFIDLRIEIFDGLIHDAPFNILLICISASIGAKM